MIKKFKQYFKDIDISNKIIIVFLPLIFLPILVTSYFYYDYYRDKSIERTTKSISDNSKLISAGIENVLNNISSCASMLTINISNIILKSNVQTDLEHIYFNNQIITEMSKSLVVFPQVDSVAFIDTKNILYSNSAQILFSKVDKEFQEIQKIIEDSNGINIFFNMAVRPSINTTDTLPTLTVGKKIFDIYTGEQLGILILNIREETFSSLFSRMNNNEGTTYLITDSRDKIISAEDKELIFKSVWNKRIEKLLSETKSFSTTTKYNDEKILATGQALENNGWKLLTITPIKSLTTDAEKAIPFLLAISIIFFIFALIGTSALSRLISKPIKLLKNNIVKVGEENLFIDVSIDSKDEIGTLSKSFTLMLVRIQELINKVNLEEKKKREYELALISAQVKPHFLYNTLDTIYVLNEMNEKSGVEKTTKALADFYRAMLSDGKDIIKIKDEVSIIKNYLVIQSTRYFDVFDYEIKIDKEVEEFAIPKFTLQPLVENAIYHGLKQKRDFGHLEVNIKSDGDYIMLIVKDNGIGMSEEIKSSLFTNSKGRSFGLFSVNERMRLYYGNRFNIKVNSVEKEGTKITIRVIKI